MTVQAGLWRTCLETTLSVFLCCGLFHFVHRYLATLEWRKGGRTSNTSIIINCKRITYYPEIIRRRKTGDTESQEIITVNHKTKKKLIYRKCYAMTEHYFASAEGNYKGAFEPHDEKTRV